MQSLDYKLKTSNTNYVTARHDVQYFPSSLSSFAPATSRVCRIPLTSGTSFIDPEQDVVVGPLSDEGLVVVEVLAGRPQAQSSAGPPGSAARLRARAARRLRVRAASSARRLHSPPCEPGRRRPRPCPTCHSFFTGPFFLLGRGPRAFSGASVKLQPGRIAFYTVFCLPIPILRGICADGRGE